MRGLSRLSRREFLAAVGALALGLLVRCRGEPAMPDLDDGFILHEMETAHLPGLAAGIVKGSRLVWAKGYGWADMARQAPMTPDTLLPIASVSKTVTAAAVMQLWEKGLFQLDDDVNRYLPFRMVNPHLPDDMVTFRHLLTHTSSLRDSAALWDGVACGDPKTPLQAWMEAYLTGSSGDDYAENFHPWKSGGRYVYCNAGFALLGCLVERLTGALFDDYCRANLFAPLDMAQSSWHFAALDPAALAVPYTYVSADGQLRGQLYREEAEQAAGFEGDSYVPNCPYSYPHFPAGRLCTSVRQLARFLMAVINDGAYQGRRILQKDSVRLMLTPQSVAGGAPWRGKQCLAWILVQLDNGDVVWGHDGGMAGVRSAMFFRAADGVGVVVLVNTFVEALAPVTERLLQEGASL